MWLCNLKTTSLCVTTHLKPLKLYILPKLMNRGLSFFFIPLTLYCLNEGQNDLHWLWLNSDA